VKKITALIVSTAAWAILAAAPARADAVDMSTITCAQLLAMKQDEVAFMLTWVQGYMAGTEEELSMDPDALGKSVTDTVAYCGENGEMSVINATKESAAK
jgi:acid stress chaperone HdeB